MARVTHFVRSILHHVFRIRPMRVMAGITLSLREGDMRLFQFCGLFGLSMACKTQFCTFHVQKVLVFCRMGWVTGEASLTAFHWFMNDANLRSLFFMAVKTEGIAFLQNQLWIL